MNAETDRNSGASSPRITVESIDIEAAQARIRLPQELKVVEEQDSAFHTKERHISTYWPFTIQTINDWTAILFLRLLALLSLGVMVLVSFTGLFKMLKGCYKIAFPKTDAERDGLPDAASGLEYLLLAPLAFMILRSLSEYVEDLQRDRKRVADYENLSEEEKLEVPEEDKKQILHGSAVSNKTKSTLLDAKALTVGLLFAILATHLVGRILGLEHASQKGNLVELIVEGVFGIVLLALLGALFLMLEKHSESLHKNDKKDEHVPP